MVGLAVTALQAATVAAQAGDPNMPPPSDNEWDYFFVKSLKLCNFKYCS